MTLVRLFRCDGRSVIAIFPECTLLAFPLVVFLRRSAGDQLHAPRDNILTGILHQKVDVIGCHNVIEHAKTETVLRVEEPVEITAPITCSERSRSAF